jgi:hypothetical protein
VNLAFLETKMSGALVPVGQTGSNFAQQGSVDWVSLSASTMSFSMEVLSRFSKAGVEMITIAVGQKIFATYNVPPEGHKRLAEAISKLKAMSSFGTALWFGFGFKHIIRTMCETEQGATCAGICACLAVSYDSFFASTVLKALADDSMTPSTLRPALSQWTSLINVCAGAVEPSNFPSLVKGFSCLFDLERRSGLLRPLHKATTAKALAEALQELSRVSNGSIRSVNIEGGVDCGWLAAVAVWLLDLRIEIINHTGDVLYSNANTKTGLYPQIMFVRHHPDDMQEQRPKLTGRSYFVPPGQLCYTLPADNAGGTGSSFLFSSGRSEWNSLLSDTFGKIVHSLFRIKNVEFLANFLLSGFSVVSWALERTKVRPITPWGTLSKDHGNADIKKSFLLFAACLLPELRSVKAYAEQNIFDTFPDLTSKCRFSSDLTAICTCRDCHSASLPADNTFCLHQIGITLFRLLWALAWFDIDASIKPSTTGLLMFYYSHNFTKDKDPDEMREHFGEQCVPSELISIFTGLPVYNKNQRATSALSTGGVCIFSSLLKDPDASPYQILRYDLVPGQIERNGAIYQQVADGVRLQVEPVRHPSLSSLITRFGSHVRLGLIVEETFSSKILEASFEVFTNGIHLEYPDFEHEHHSDTWEQDSASAPGGMQSLFPAAMRTRIMESMYSPPCFNTNVEISSPHYLASSLVGTCSTAISKLMDNEAYNMPSLLVRDEWVLVERNFCCVQVLRGSYPLLFSVLCQLSPEALVNLTFVERCLLCSTRRGRYRFAMILYSMVEGQNPPSGSELIKSITWSPYTRLTEPGGEMSTIALSLTPNNSGSVQSMPTPIERWRKKHVFYAEKARWVLKAFLRRRGIAFKRLETDYHLIRLLELHDLDHPDAAGKDGFLEGDFDEADVRKFGLAEETGPDSYMSPTE